MRRWSCQHLTNFVFKLSVLVFLTAGSLKPAFADGVVTSDFVFQLDNSIFSDAKFEFASKLQGQETVALSDRVIQDEAPVSVKGIQAQVAYKLKASANRITLGAELSLVSESFSVQLNIAEIAVDAWVDKVVGSHIVRSHVVGTCSNIQMSLPQGSGVLMGSLLVAPDRNGRPVISIPWFEASWGSSAWTIAPFTCAAAPGFDAKMAAGLKKFLSTPDAMNAQLKDVLNQKMVAQQKTIDDWFQQSMQIGGDVNGLRLMLKPKAVQNLKGDQFQLRGDLDFIFASSKLNQALEVRGGGAPKTGSLFTMMLPDGLLSTLTDVAYRSGFFNYRKRGQEIAAFRDLMNGTLSKWYVWAELNSFPKDADILFDFSAPTAPRLSGFTDGGDGSLFQAISGSLNVLVWSPTATGHEKQIQFMTPVDGTYRFWFEKNTAGVTQFRTIFGPLAMNLSHVWDPAYLPHARDTAVNDATMQTQVMNSLKTDGFSLDMSRFVLTDSITLSPTSLHATSGWLLIDWK